jgi:DNA-binding NarL/FixJ family response regulator
MPEHIVDLYEKGVRGIIPIESTSLPLVMKIIQLVNAGGTFVPLSCVSLRSADWDTKIGERLPGNQLTNREKTVLNLLKHGKPNKVIACELGLSESTVKLNVRKIIQKMGVHNRTEAVCRALSGQGRIGQ